MLADAGGSCSAITMFGTVLTVVVTLLQAYVFWRLASMSALRRRGWRAALIAVGLVLWAIFLAGRLYGHGSAGRLAATLESVGMVWMVVLFLTAVCFLAVDAVTGFGAFFPPAVPRLRGAALAAGMLLSVVAFIQGHRSPVIESFAVPLAGLPPELEGKTIVALSDLHLGATLDGAWLAARVQQVMAERPDLVVLLGDVVEGHGEADGNLASILSGLAAPLGVWGVLGNHESHGRAAKNTAFLTKAGVRVPRNAWTEIRPGLVLAGVNDRSSGERNGRVVADVPQTLPGPPPGAAILLSHTPVGADIAAARGVSLMLCGHTHGGQIWPFSYLVRLRYPLLDGRYTVDGMTVIVCRGTGTWGPRMRLWSPGSILRITLRRA
jgi:uncharacterized protein